MAFVFALCLTAGLQAERGNYTVGSGTGTTNEAPVNNTFRNPFTEIIYRASYINSRPGRVESISFKYAFDVIMTEKPAVTIYLANTTVEEFETARAWQLDNLQRVYTGAFNCHEGWNTLEFDTTFFYTGNNLLVVIDDYSGSYDGEAYKFYFTQSWGNTVLRTQNDNGDWSVGRWLQQVVHLQG